MDREELLKIVRGAMPGLMTRHGVLPLDLFGSFARGEAGPESDVDFLVTFHVDPTFNEYMGLKEELEALLKRNVDLVTLKGLKPRVRAAVLLELHRVA